jgi:hypothetical protein
MTTSVTFRRPHDLGTPDGITIVNINNEKILKFSQ